MTCRCVCHSSNGTYKLRCSIDRGSSGLPDIPSCSPCAYEPVAATEPTSKLFCVMSHPKPIQPVYGRICGHHYRTIGEQLQEIVELYALLPLYLLSTGNDGGEQKPTKNAEPPAPMRLDITALADRRTDPTEQRVSLELNGHRYESNGAESLPSIPATLQEWADYIREERHLTPPARIFTFGPVHPGTCGHSSCRLIRDRGLVDPLLTSVQLLTTHLEWLCADEQLPGMHTRWTILLFAADVKKIRSTLRSLTGDPLPRPLGKCYVDVKGDGKECGGPIWEAKDGEGARCGTCGEKWTGHELIRLRLIMERQDREASRIG